MYILHGPQSRPLNDPPANPGDGGGEDQKDHFIGGAVGPGRPGPGVAEQEKIQGVVNPYQSDGGESPGSQPHEGPRYGGWILWAVIQQCTGQPENQRQWEYQER